MVVIWWFISFSFNSEFSDSSIILFSFSFISCRIRVILLKLSIIISWKFKIYKEPGSVKIVPETSKFSSTWSNVSYRSSHPVVFCKKGVLTNFTKFTGKHLCQILCNFIKKESLVQVFFCEFCEISKNIFSYIFSPVVASVRTLALCVFHPSVNVGGYYFLMVSFSHFSWWNWFQEIFQ